MHPPPQVSYNRWHEGRIRLQAMTAAWTSVACKALAFDGGMTAHAPPAADGCGPMSDAQRWRLEVAHLLSLAHALALQFLRCDWSLATLCEHEHGHLPAWVRAQHYSWCRAGLRAAASGPGCHHTPDANFAAASACLQNAYKGGYSAPWWSHFMLHTSPGRRVRARPSRGKGAGARLRAGSPSPACKLCHQPRVLGTHAPPPHTQSITPNVSRPKSTRRCRSLWLACPAPQRRRS